jgi:hypothetical protein
MINASTRFPTSSIYRRDATAGPATLRTYGARFDTALRHWPQTGQNLPKH